MGILKVGLAMLLASLCSSLSLNRTIKPPPAPVIIIKADDLTDPSSASWQAFFKTVQALDIQASVGVIAKEFVASPENVARVQSHHNSGNFEFWNHGYSHASFPFPKPTATPVADDYDGDLTADPATIIDGRWTISVSASGQNLTYPDPGVSNPQPAPADYDADGKTDISLIDRNRKWLIDYSANGFGRWDLDIPPPRNADPPTNGVLDRGQTAPG
ncbi:MAG: hypothetical protein RLZZ09_3492 [Pseudomonadota bacterium]|jgi:hypothetical protein